MQRVTLDQARELHRAILSPETREVRGFLSRRGFLTMPDGVRLAVTWWLPDPLHAGERVPVVLCSEPYRKDDDGFIYAYEVYPYLAARGIAVARVDVRGTGTSEGATPDREYSDAELADLTQVVAQLADEPWCNGNVGMMGISWSGFNSIMTAMRRPPALKAILVAHACTDLYGNDVHYIDGCLHLDVYSLEVEVENVVPRWPDYTLDEAYFRDRFEREPWLLPYIRHQRDGSWWQTGRSLESDWAALDVPVYCIGGLLDGYRDFVPALLENADVPVYAEMGPWNHFWPHDGPPLPDYEWRRTAVRWFRHWLGDGAGTGDGAGAGDDAGAADVVPFAGKTLTVFRRGAVPPDSDAERTPGEFELHTWPVSGSAALALTPLADRTLAVGGAAGEAAAVHRLDYVAGSGVVIGNWWGEPTPDVAGADAHALVYDSAPLGEAVRVLGAPQAALRVSVEQGDRPAGGSSGLSADWFVRLEDVWPDGRVSLVTGGGINGAQRSSRTEPQALVPGEEVSLTVPLRFSTYTFVPGHRIRMVVTNAQFPMVWPSPQRMVTTLRVGGATAMLLPSAPAGRPVAMPGPVLDSPQAPDAEVLASQPLTPFAVLRDDSCGITLVEEREGSAVRVGQATLEYENVIRRWVDNSDPARAGLVGRGREVITLPGRTLTVRAVVRVASDERSFHVTVRRSIAEDGVTVRSRTWHETVPRDFQ